MTIIKNIIIIIMIILKKNRKKSVQFCFGDVMMAVLCHHIGHICEECD